MPFLFLYLVFSQGHSAQELEPQIPVTAPPRFSQVVGDYRITSAASPLEVRVEDPIKLTVEIQGRGPAKYQPARKNLQIFPDDMSEQFHLEAWPEQDQAFPDKGRWVFVYKLRPKRTGPIVIPELQLIFLRSVWTEFQSSFSEEIPIKVLPAPETTAKNMGLKVVDAPASFTQLRPVEEMVRDDTPLPTPGLRLMAVLLLLPPAGCLVWYWLWRRMYPNAAERRLRRRSRAANQALAYLAEHELDVMRIRAAAVDFLRIRLDLPTAEATPADVAQHLKRLWTAKPLVASWSAFLQSCDRCQYAPIEESAGKALHLEAMDLITTLEADPCVGR
jgi:hypothetical protein